MHSAPLWHIPSVSPWPLVLVAALTLGGCGRAAREPLHVSAAVSLTDVLTSAALVWERESRESVTLNFAASNVLSRQIEAGAPVDLFVSADAAQMDRLAGRGLMKTGSIVPLLTNQLVVIAPSDRPLRPPMPARLGDTAVRRIAIGDPSAVPVGVYARTWLERAGLWEAVVDKIVPAGSAWAALAAVDAGNADAGIVYRTDAAGRPRVVVVYEVPAEHGPAIVYPAGIPAASRHAERAGRLLDWLRGQQAAAIFTAAGFGVAGRDARAP